MSQKHRLVTKPERLTVATTQTLSARVVEVLDAPSWAAHGRLPLGNLRRPLDELIFILLTTMTQYGVTQSFRAVKSQFKPWRRLLAPHAERDLRNTIHHLGLSRQKANNIVNIAATLKRDFGHVTLSPIQSMVTRDAEAYLTGLPGVGKKVARCVLMYSLGRDVLPVDTHVFRVSARLGLIEPQVRYENAHDILQSTVPAGIRYRMHVGLVNHGKQVCVPDRPSCGTCILKSSKLCPGV